MKVVDSDQQPAPGIGRAGEPRRYRLEAHEPFGGPVEGVGTGQQVGRAEPPQDHPPRPERRRTLLLGGPPHGRDDTPGGGVVDEVLEQPGLAGAGIAGQQAHDRRTGKGLVEPASQGRALDVATHERTLHGRTVPISACAAQ
jgi:hypothetical protein